MKFVLVYLFTLFFLSHQGIAQQQISHKTWKLVERESESIFFSNHERSKKKALKSRIINEIKSKGIIDNLIQGKYEGADFINLLLSSNSFSKELDECLQVHENQKLCTELIITEELKLLRSLSYLDDLAVLILSAYIEQDQKKLYWIKQKNISLKNYFLTLSQTEKVYLKNNTHLEATLLAKRNYRKQHPVWGNITPRQELYLNYNFIEIKILSQILIKTQERMLAQQAFIAWDFDGDGTIDESFKTPESWKYDLALTILDYTIQQETLSQGKLANHQITKQHLLMAASELGLVKEAMLQELVTLPDFKKPKSDKPELYLRALWAISKTALLAIPGGIYFILPIIVIETVVEHELEKKKDKPRVI
jgi:hypothetical protein